MKTGILIFAGIVATAAGIFASQHWFSIPPTTSSSTNPDERPYFALHNFEDELIGVDTWDGQWVLINFWGTWCPPCVKEMPALNELHKKFRDQNFTVLGIAADTKETALAFTQEYALEFPILYGFQPALEISKKYGNARSGLPFTAIINPQKQIVFRELGELNIGAVEKFLEKHLESSEKLRANSDK